MAEEGVCAVGAARVQTLDVILTEEGRTQFYIDYTRSDQVDAPHWLVLIDDYLILAELSVLHTVANLLEQLIGRP